MSVINSPEYTNAKDEERYLNDTANIFSPILS